MTFCTNNKYKSFNEYRWFQKFCAGLKANRQLSKNFVKFPLPFFTLCACVCVGKPLSRFLFLKR